MDQKYVVMCTFWSIGFDQMVMSRTDLHEGIL